MSPPLRTAEIPFANLLEDDRGPAGLACRAPADLPFCYKRVFLSNRLG